MHMLILPLIRILLLILTLILMQGELYFLRVSPFGAGHEDGFWRHVVGAPWEAGEESVRSSTSPFMCKRCCKRTLSIRILSISKQYVSVYVYAIL